MYPPPLQEAEMYTVEDWRPGGPVDDLHEGMSLVLFLAEVGPAYLNSVRYALDRLEARLPLPCEKCGSDCGAKDAIYGNL